MKKCLQCDFVWMKEYGEPVSCSYGLYVDAKPIGGYCGKNKRKNKRMKEREFESYTKKQKGKNV